MSTNHNHRQLSMEEIKIMIMVSMKEIMVAKHMARPPPGPKVDLVQDQSDTDDDSLCEVQRILRRMKACQRLF